MEPNVHFPFDYQMKKIQKKSSSTSTFNQVELNCLMHDLKLSKVNFQLLYWRLKEKNTFAPGTNITFLSAREQEF